MKSMCTLTGNAITEATSNKWKVGKVIESGTNFLRRIDSNPLTNINISIIDRTFDRHRFRLIDLNELRMSRRELWVTFLDQRYFLLNDSWAKVLGFGYHHHHYHFYYYITFINTSSKVQERIWILISNKKERSVSRFQIKSPQSIQL